MEKTQNKRGQKLYYYLSRMSDKDLRDFHDYLQSPLLGNSPQFARMLRIIQDKVLRTERTTIDADLFAMEFFQRPTLDEKEVKYIRIRLVQFLDKVLDFASFMDYRGDRNARDIHLLKSMYKRGWEKHFEKVYEEIEAQPPVKEDGEYLMYKLWKGLVKYEVDVDQIHQSVGPNFHAIVAGIEELHNYLQLKFAVIMQNDEGLIGKPLGIPMPTKLLEQLSNTPSGVNPEMESYYHAYCLANGLAQDSYDGTDDHFHQLKQMLPSLTDMDRSDWLNQFQIANNYCLKRIRQGIHVFRQELTNLYDAALRKGMLSNKGLLPRSVYKNIVLNMCRIGEVDWAESFVEKWKHKIAGDKDHIFYYHNKAQIHLARREFDQVIELQYNRVSLYEDALYALAARVYVCRALWEKGEYQWLLSVLEAMRQYILRAKEVKKVDKANYVKFVHYLTKMAIAKLAQPDLQLPKLKKIQSEMYAKQDHLGMGWTHGALLAMIDSMSA